MKKDSWIPEAIEQFNRDTQGIPTFILGAYTPNEPRSPQKARKAKSVWIPSQDGVTHINVYSKGATPLGRALTNFAHTPFECEDGHFESVEGYWYWLGTNHPERDTLRWLYGWEAKQLGRELGAIDWHEDDPQFVQKIKSAIDAKLRTHSYILEPLRRSTLPLTHYYVFGRGPNMKIVEPRDGRWILEHLESKRNA